MINGNRVWLYCRVPSGANSEETVKAQENELKHYAREHGFRIAGCTGDIGDGLTLDRPGLRKFHAAMEAKKTDVLLVSNLSRLGRDLDKVMRYWRTLREHSVRLYTVADGEIYLDMYTLLLEVFQDREETA